MLAFTLGLAIVGEMVSSSVGATNKKNAIVRSETRDKDLLMQREVTESKDLQSRFDINRYRQSINGSSISNLGLLKSYEKTKSEELKKAQDDRYRSTEDIYDAKYKMMSDSIYEDILAKTVNLSLKAADSYENINRNLLRQRLASYYEEKYNSDGLNLHDSFSTGNLLDGIHKELDVINNIRLDKY